VLNAIRWLFRSRSSRRLTGLTFVILSVLIAALISLAVTPPLRTMIRARRSFDWFAAEQPAVLDAKVSDGFMAEFRLLVARLRNARKKPPSPSLIFVDQDTGIETTKPCSDTNAKLFEEIPVYPGCTTFAKKAGEPSDRGENPRAARPARAPALVFGELTKTELEVFEEFSRYTQELSQRADPNRKDHFEKILASALRVPRLPGDDSDLSTPWLYVASAAGAIAVFPGTKVIGLPRWDIAGRPWYQASMGIDTKLATSGIEPGDLMTVTYLDVLGESPLHVRTYLRRFEINNETFVVGVDLHRPNTRPSRYPALGSLSSYSLSSEPIYVLTFAGSLLAFGALAAITFRRDTQIQFEGYRAYYGKVEDSRTDVGEAGSERSSTGGIELKKGWLVVGQTREDRRDSYIKRETKVTTHSRGVQYWDVWKTSVYSWRLIREFESSHSKLIGVLRLEYTRSIRPDVDWFEFDKKAFSKNEAGLFKSRIPQALAAHADAIRDDELSIPASALSEDATAPIDVPEFVRPLLTPDDGVAIQHKRAYTTFRSGPLAELYKNAHVEAVVLSTYLSQMLESSDLSFLTQGRTIRRLISFPSATDQLKLSKASRERFAGLLKQYSTRSRLLERVNVPIPDPKDLQPVYDFALLDFGERKGDDKKRIVIVSHFLSEATRIDPSGAPMAKQHVVEGYVSWRDADVKFYSKLFDELPPSQPLEVSVEDETEMD
jgi:hypothetical protein